jgi:hypothetical protein
MSPVGPGQRTPRCPLDLLGSYITTGQSRLRQTPCWVDERHIPLLYTYGPVQEAAALDRLVPHLLGVLATTQCVG